MIDATRTLLYAPVNHLLAYPAAHQRVLCGPDARYRVFRGNASSFVRSDQVTPIRPPKVRDTVTPVSVTLPDDPRGMTPELGALICRGYVRGLSTRDVAGVYAEAFGAIVSKSTASRDAQALQAEFDTWCTRDLSEYKVPYLFLDSQFHAACSGSDAQEGILAAYALCEDGKVVLLHLGLGPRESTDAWVAFLHDLTARNLSTPLLVITDGNPGLTRAVRQVFPGVRRQRCQVHKPRNILAKLPRPAATQLKPLLQQVFLAPDHATGLRLGQALIARFCSRYPSAMECLEKDLDECLTYLLFPAPVCSLIRCRTRPASGLQPLQAYGFPGVRGFGAGAMRALAH